jgi:phosphoribosylaminoimidazole-succinocarboxamide synthase
MSSNEATGFSSGEELTLPGWDHAYSGKVRDLYVPAGESLATTPRILVVASDRVSAFDHVLEPGIPGKGALLTRLSLWWFAQLDVPNHLIPNHLSAGEETANSVTRIPTAFPSPAILPSIPVAIPTAIPEAVADRAMLVANLSMFPVECVVRAYLSGSGWLEYQQSQSVCGIALPAGLRDGDKLPEPLYTPAFKAAYGDHDENITFERTIELLGLETASALRDLSLSIFADAAAIAENRGIILADTKFEFGADRETGIITLADEVLTSDSSRYWDAATYAAGTTPTEKMHSFDKQIVRNWLSANWNKIGTPPVLPAEIVGQTSARYGELINRMLG